MRAAARTLDSLSLLLLAAFPDFLQRGLVAATGRSAGDDAVEIPLALTCWATFLAYSVVDTRLFLGRGQTIGKAVLRLRIVGARGGEPSRGKLLWLRRAPWLVVLWLLPSIAISLGQVEVGLQLLAAGGFVTFASLAIGTVGDHRPLHDRVAGTAVVSCQSVRLKTRKHQIGCARRGARLVLGLASFSLTLGALLASSFAAHTLSTQVLRTYRSEFDIGVGDRFTFEVYEVDLEESELLMSGEDIDRTISHLRRNRSPLRVETDRVVSIGRQASSWTVVRFEPTNYEGRARVLAIDGHRMAYLRPDGQYRTDSAVLASLNSKLYDLDSLSEGDEIDEFHGGSAPEVSVSMSAPRGAGPCLQASRLGTKGHYWYADYLCVPIGNVLELDAHWLSGGTARVLVKLSSNY